MLRKKQLTSQQPVVLSGREHGLPSANPQSIGQGGRTADSTPPKREVNQRPHGPTPSVTNPRVRSSPIGARVSARGDGAAGAAARRRATARQGRRRRLSSSTATGKTRSPPAAQSLTNLLVHLHPAEGLIAVCCLPAVCLPRKVSFSCCTHSPRTDALAVCLPFGSSWR